MKSKIKAYGLSKSKAENYWKGSIQGHEVRIEELERMLSLHRRLLSKAKRALKELQRRHTQDSRPNGIKGRKKIR